MEISDYKYIYILISKKIDERFFDTAIGGTQLRVQHNLIFPQSYTDWILHKNSQSILIIEVINEGR